MDGIRARYTFPGSASADLPADSSLAYLYDPSGNTAQRMELLYNNDPNQTDGLYVQVRDNQIYDAYGALSGRIDTVSYPSVPMDLDPAGFGGQEGYYTDTETGLVLLGARYYDPSTGRFLNRDPTGYAGGINLYVFCGNNPVMESDPSGDDPNVPINQEYLQQQGLIPGKFAAKEGGYVDVPARLTNVRLFGTRVPASLRAATNENGALHGCHTCGSATAGTRSGNFIFDHQPPIEANPSGAPQRAYPQCISCMHRQGGIAKSLGTGNPSRTQQIMEAVENFWRTSREATEGAAETARGVGEHAGLLGGLFILEDYALRNRDHSFKGFMNSVMNATAPGPVFDLRYMLPENQHPIPGT